MSPSAQCGLSFPLPLLPTLLRTCSEQVRRVCAPGPAAHVHTQGGPRGLGLVFGWGAPASLPHPVPMRPADQGSPHTCPPHARARARAHTQGLEPDPSSLSSGAQLSEQNTPQAAGPAHHWALALGLHKAWESSGEILRVTSLLKGPGAGLPRPHALHLLKDIREGPDLPGHSRALCGPRDTCQWPHGPHSDMGIGTLRKSFLIHSLPHPLHVSDWISRLLGHVLCDFFFLY